MKNNIKKFKFKSTLFELDASITLEVNLDTFSKYHKDIASFWEKIGDGVDTELLALKYVASTAINVAMQEDWNIYGVTTWFDSEDAEGFAPLKMFGIKITEMDVPRGLSSDDMELVK